MEPAVYQYGTFVRGDTIPKRVFTVTKTIAGNTNPINLSNYEIKCDFVLNKTRVSRIEGAGITVSDAANGVFEIDAFSLDKAGVYSFDIQFTEVSSDVIQTYIKGTIKIVEDVTQ